MAHRRPFSAEALRSLAVAVGLLLCCLPVSGQTRADEIARQQQEKAASAEPDMANGAERFFEQFEDGKWFFVTPRGWYPVFGSIYPGGGFAAGAGYRHHVGYDSYVDASAMYSLSNYKLARIAGSTPNHWGDRVDLAGSLSWLDAPSVPFYGLGNDSSADDRSSFAITRKQVAGVATLHVVDWLRLQLDGGIDDYTQRHASGPFPSIEERFTAQEAALQGQHLRYLRGEASAAVVWLQSPGYSRRGGLYRFAYEEFNPLIGDGGTFGFARTELVQHVPLLRETWVVSMRARTESVIRKSDVVPYFLMPSLGSGTTLRAYPTGRFRDRHTLLLSSELRWFPNRLGFDMALFADAGSVASARSKLSVADMVVDYGIGARFHTPTSTVLRIELARGREGWRPVFTASAPF